MKTPCPTDRLPLLVQDRLPAQESSAVLSHIEDCDDCQCRLDGIGADESWWQRAGRGLSGTKIAADGQRPSDGDPLHELIVVEPRIEGDADTGSPRQAGDCEQDWPAGLLEPAGHPELLGRIDEFDVEEKIGQGGMGVVFRGFDRSLNRPVAIKVMAPHLGTNAVARQRFAREAQAAASVVNPHVVPIHRVSSSGGHPYIAMALVDGHSLQQHIAQHGPLAPREVVRVSMQIAEGLAAAHRQGLIHRDIKPANVLLERDARRAMITDFGLARAIDDVAMTQSGCLAGTPHYMSPEQVTDAEVDDRSDLFSVGSLMYFIATGREPFQAATAFGVISRIVSDCPPLPRQVNPDIPEELSRIIGRLLEKKPDHRLSSAGELHGLLTDYLAHLNDPQHHPVPVVRAPRRRKRDGLRMFLACSTAAALAVLLWAAIIGFPDLAGPDRSGHRSHDEAADGHHAEEHHHGESDH